MGNLMGFYIMPHPPVLIPEIGKGDAEKLSDTASACLKIADEIKAIKPDTIIVITPHGPVFRDAVAIYNDTYAYGDFENFGAPDVAFNFNINMDITEELIKKAEADNILIAKINEDTSRQYNIEHKIDHGALVPLYFIQKKYTDFKLVHITYGMLPKMNLFKFGTLIKKAVDESSCNAVIIASGDLSHKLTVNGTYGFNPDGPVFDKKIIELLEAGDTLNIFSLDKKLVNEAAECGLRSFYILLGAMDGLDFKGEKLSYEGPYGVGYGVMKFDIKSSTKDSIFDILTNQIKSRLNAERKNEDLYVRLARESLVGYVKSGNYIKMPGYVTEDMISSSHGVFVSLKKDGDLRGCIGTIYPVYKNTAEEIIRNAVEAGENDPRFYPVEEDELDDIEYSVDVLMMPSACTFDELDPKKYGVIVRSGRKSGLLLPDLEGIDKKEDQVAIALKKAGISKNEEYTIEKFEVIRHR